MKELVVCYLVSARGKRAGGVVKGLDVFLGVFVCVDVNGDKFKCFTPV